MGNCRSRSDVQCPTPAFCNPGCCRTLLFATDIGGSNCKNMRAAHCNFPPLVCNTPFFATLSAEYSRCKNGGGGELQPEPCAYFTIRFPNIRRKIRGFRQPGLQTRGWDTVRQIERSTVSICQLSGLSVSPVQLSGCRNNCQLNYFIADRRKVSPVQ